MLWFWKWYVCLSSLAILGGHCKSFSWDDMNNTKTNVKGSVLGDVICNDANSCTNGIYKCNYAQCNFGCYGENSCMNSKFICNDLCVATCGNGNACSQSTFYFNGTSYGNDVITCQSDHACGNSKFVVSNNTFLVFECDGYYSCNNTTLYIQDTSTVDIACTEIGSCQNLKCYCEQDGCEINSSIECETM